MSTTIQNPYISNETYDLFAKSVTTASVFLSIVSIAVYVLMIIAMWKVFSKAGKPGWAALIPVYNIVVLLQVAGLNPLLTLIIIGNLIPIVNFFAAIAWLVISIIAYCNIAKAFGKSGGFAVGMIFLPVIFWCILAFDKSEYLGISNNQV